MSVNALRRRRVQPPQHAMQVLGPVLIGAGAQSAAQLLGALRAGKKSVQQSAEIESRASADDGQIPSLPAFAATLSPRSYFAHNHPGLASILTRVHVSQRIHTIQKVMGNFRALRRRRLGGANVKFAVHRDRVAVDDFSPEAARDRQRQSGLPTGRGAKHDHEQGLAIRIRQLPLLRLRQRHRFQRAPQGI